MYLGIDIGTSSVKTVLFDRDQRLIAQASQSLTVQRPHPGWSEQDPEAWWQGVESTIDALARDNALAGLRGIGLSGQMHGAVCLDHDDQVLRPAILWNDGRAMPNAPRSKPPSRARARSPATSRCRASPRRRSPGCASTSPRPSRRIDTVLLPKDYIRFRLTGHHVSEMSDASGTLWLDVAARDWSDDLLEATGLTRAHMPRLVEGSAPSGDLMPELAGRWGVERPGRRRRRRRRQRRRGLRRRRRHARARPSSRSAPRACSSSPTPHFSPNTEGAVHAFCHAIPDTWHQMGVILSASDSLEWLSRIAGRKRRRARRGGRSAWPPPP